MIGVWYNSIEVIQILVMVLKHCILCKTEKICKHASGHPESTFKLVLCGAINTTIGINVKFGIARESIGIVSTGYILTVHLLGFFPQKV